MPSEFSNSKGESEKDLIAFFVCALKFNPTNQPQLPRKP